MINFKKTRDSIKLYSNIDTNRGILERLGIDITRDNKFKVRAEERTPSCIINKDGSFHDYGSSTHYSDIVSLLFDGYNSFNSVRDTMEWVCHELGISWEDGYE